MRVKFSISILAALLLMTATSCSDNDDNPSVPEGYISDKLPTNDVIKKIVSGAYLEYGSPENDDFAEAVMIRHTSGKAIANSDKVKSVFIDKGKLRLREYCGVYHDRQDLARG